MTVDFDLTGGTASVDSGMVDLGAAVAREDATGRADGAPRGRALTDATGGFDLAGGTVIAGVGVFLLLPRDDGLAG